MTHLKESLPNSESQVSPLEREILTMGETIKQLQAENLMAKNQLANQQAIEKKYEESQSRFEAIFNQSMLGNKIITPDLKIIQVNQSLQQMLGYDQEELIGTKIIKFAHPDFIHHWQELQTKLWEERIPAFQIETPLIKKDGAILWCQVTSILFQDQDISLGFTMVEDISKRKQLELELKKQYDNQETMMHMVAHDLKSPLHNIKLAASFLKENLEELLANQKESQEETLTYVDLISDTTDKALLRIKDLLIIGEIESSYPMQQDVNLNALIQTCLDLLSPSAQKKNLELKFIAPNKTVYARIDPEKFQRAIENLLSNAIKFSKSGGQVIVSLKQEGDKAHIIIQDRGIGIPTNLQAAIFNKFTPAGRTGTNGEPTTGLGLYIVKQIIEKHGGKIWVESEENVGTTFFVQLN